ncbi:MAG: prepilin-type N-terminal cleavage/methylation domain-containing protein, partial [Bdellovibrionales bacterium]|nr:prepilin-type N-terminal cleavage/methylation domain-containing protein [Bdellovibrionales bacterium]
MATQAGIKTESGFTLIEIVIAVMILAFLGVFTSQSLRNAIKFKSKIQKDVDQQSQVKNAMMIMERDINLAFHHRDILGALNQKVLAASQGQATATGQPGAIPGIGVIPGTGGAAGAAAGIAGAGATAGPFDPNDPALSADPIGPDGQPRPNVTQFVGEEKKMSFTSRSNARLFENAMESDQLEVSYQLTSCKTSPYESRNTKSGDTVGQCLSRRTSPILDGDLTKGGKDIQILENVIELKFRYFGDGKSDWVTSWKSDKDGDDQTRGRFPLAVEITLTTEKNKRKTTLATVATIRFPNNPVNKADPSGAS